MSTPEASWHHLVQLHVNALVSDEDFAKRHILYPDNTPQVLHSFSLLLMRNLLNAFAFQLKETFYYRTLFHKHYRSANVIPHYWLPRFCGNIVDPSARELTAAVGIEIGVAALPALVD